MFFNRKLLIRITKKDLFNEQGGEINIFSLKQGQGFEVLSNTPQPNFLLTVPGSVSSVQ